MVADVQNLRVGNGTEQVADKTVEFRISDEMSRLLLTKRTAQNTGQAEQRWIAASQTVRTAICADQLALNAKCRGLKGNEINVFEGIPINCFTKHQCDPRER